MATLNWNSDYATFGDIKYHNHYGATAMSSRFKVDVSNAVIRCFTSLEVDCSPRNRDRYIGMRSSSTAVRLMPEHKHTANPVAVAYSYAEPIVLVYHPDPDTLDRNSFGFPQYDSVKVYSIYKFSPTTQQHQAGFGARNWIGAGDKPKPHEIKVNAPLSTTQPQDWIEQMVYDINQELDKAVRCRKAGTAMSRMDAAVYWYDAIFNVALSFDVDVDAALTELGKDVDAGVWGDKMTANLIKWRLKGEAMAHHVDRALQLINVIKERMA